MSKYKASSKRIVKGGLDHGLSWLSMPVIAGYTGRQQQTRNTKFTFGFRIMNSDSCTVFFKSSMFK